MQSPSSPKMTRQRRSRQRRPDRQTDSPLPQRKTIAVDQDQQKPQGELSADDLRKTKSSPLVRISQKSTASTFEVGRHRDERACYEERHPELYRIGRALTPQTGDAARGKGAHDRSPARSHARTSDTAASRNRRSHEQMSVMRKRIAEHMTLSQRTSAHVTTVYEIDMTRVVKLREQYKNSFFQMSARSLVICRLFFRRLPEQFDNSRSSIRRSTVTRFCTSVISSRNGRCPRLGPDCACD